MPYPLQIARLNNADLVVATPGRLLDLQRSKNIQLDKVQFLVVDEGDRIRLTGEGEIGVNGGPAGDLYVQMQIKPHAVFERDGDDLHCEMPISFTVAALGGEIDIPTLDGHAQIKIPPETQSGKIFRLRGKGIKGVRSHATGDLQCHMVVETPVKLTERQKELLREFEVISQADSPRHNPRAKGWMDKVKDFFAD